ncbi:MAG: MATE family efflux transporter [Acetatifactor sp.]|nr:MATE family efflux transporter [Acetatifactor sp.]
MSESKKYEIDMCNGPLLGKVLLFSIPLILSGVLQLLFNAADTVVVGRWAGNNALAAVGATSSLVNLLVNLFIGLSIGANVLVARYFGSDQKDELTEMVSTSVVTAFLSGIILIFLGFFLARPLLVLMKTPKDIIDLSVLYLKIYFAGMPFLMLYNFGSAILRAIGDTRRPLIYLSAAGVLNVLLNLIFVIVFNMSVAGVALATTISQGLSAFLVIRCLYVTDGDYKLIISELRISPEKMIKMFQIGIPAGVQGMFFSISNMLIQSAVNSFGSIVVAGNTASGNIEGFVYISMNAIYQTSISFVGQNYGAKKFDRIKKIIILNHFVVFFVGCIMGFMAYYFRNGLVSIYSTDPEVIFYGAKRLSIICSTYFLCGMMDVAVGLIRGMGYSLMPMFVSLLGSCVFRIVYIYTYFAAHRSLEVLYMSYPISWFLTWSVHIICMIVIFNREKRKISTLESK